MSLNTLRAAEELQCKINLQDVGSNSPPWSKAEGSGSDVGPMSDAELVEECVWSDGTEVVDSEMEDSDAVVEARSGAVEVDAYVMGGISIELGIEGLVATGPGIGDNFDGPT